MATTRFIKSRLFAGSALALGSFFTASFAAAQEAHEIVVEGKMIFRDTQASSALKMPLSVKDTPQTIITVTEDVIEFASIDKFEDVYKIDATGGSSNLQDGVARNYYRGFHLPRYSVNTLKVDGFRVLADFSFDLAPFERFEIVKGATSTIYGQNSVGGSLNAISKKPVAGLIGGEILFEAGAIDHYRGEMDLYGSLSSDDKLAFRFVGAYQNSGAFYDFGFDRRIVLAPSLEYAFSEKTRARLSVNYQKQKLNGNPGFGAHFRGPGLSNPDVPDVPRSRTGNVPWGKLSREVLMVNGVLEHELGDNWLLRSNVQYNRVTATGPEAFLRITDENDLTEIVFDAADTKDETYAAEVNLYGDAELLGGTHTLFFGADYASLPTFAAYPFGTAVAGSTMFNILDPDYSIFPPLTEPSDFDNLFLFDRDRKIMGATAQAILRPVDGLQVILGARYSRDVLRLAFGCCDIGATSVVPADEVIGDKVTFQGAATYAVTDDINLYASYGETYEPSTTRVFDGSIIDPEEGRAYEVGAKGELFDQNLLWTLAVFHIERTNIASADPINIGFSIPIGAQRSQGIEFDMRGELTPGWNIFLSTGILDSEFIDGDFSGGKPANAPKFGLSVYSSYEFLEGPFQDWGFGGGVVHKSGRQSNDLDGIGGLASVIGKDIVDDFTELDLRVFYSRDNWRFTLSATNVLDTLYYSTRTPRLLNAISANPSRMIRGSISYNF